VSVVLLQEWTAVAVLAAWFTFAAVFLLRRRAPPAAERQRDPMGTLGLVLQGMGFGLFWGIRRPTGAPFVDASFTVLVALSVVAIALAAGSVALTFWSVRTLGRQWALAARLVEAHELVTGGPYRYIRHPSYLGMMLGLVGWALVFRSFVGLLAAVLGLRVLNERIESEERMLASEFGDAYADYRRRTWRLVPWVY